MGRALKSCLLASALAVLASGCGSGSSSTQTQAALAKCPFHKGITAAGWSGRVSGISCAEAGKFIEHHALDDLFPLAQAKASTTAEIRALKPGNYTSAGFGCHYVSLRNGQGWHVNCEHSQQVVDFLVTP
jgi:hypothetical protein